MSWQAVSVLLVQVVMTADIAGRLVLGFHPIGGTEYLWDAAHPRFIRLLSLFHVAVPPLLVWLLARTGYDRRAILLQTATAWVVLPLSWLFGPERDINWTWGPFDAPQEAVSPGAYLAICMAAYPLALYPPSHLALGRLFGRPVTGRGSTGTDRPARP